MPRFDCSHSFGISLPLVLLWATFISVGNASELAIEAGEKHLSWQSAMFAVTVIAFTNMQDIPSTVDGYPKELIFYLKANPFLCLMDVLKTFSVLLPRAGSSLDRRLLLLATEKFGDHDHKHLGRRKIRLGWFVLGSMPQAIKLYACRGLLFTQLIASCYLLDFLVDELVLLYASRKTRSRESNTESDTVRDPQTDGSTPRVTKSIRVRLAFFANALWSIMLLYRGSAITVFYSDGMLAGVGTFLFTPAVLSLHFLILYVFKPSETTKSEIALFLSPFVMAWYCLPFSITPLNIPFSDITYDIDPGWRILHLVFTLGAIAHGCYTVFQSKLWALRTTSVAHFPKKAYLMLVLVNLFGYYLTLYDAAQTSKPFWMIG